MNRIIILIALALCAFASTGVTNAETTAIARLAMTPEGAPCYDYGLIAPAGEFWVFGANTKAPSYEAGRLFEAHKGKKSLLLVGGYIAFWPGQKMVLAEPYLYGCLCLPAGFKLDGTLGVYAPLGRKGDVVLYTDTIALTRAMGDVALGGGITFWVQGNDPTQVRPAAIGRLKNWELRVLPPVANRATEVRFKYSLTFR